jgi:outer membrane protein OmpA-like peptidoglycan-associated protein
MLRRLLFLHALSVLILSGCSTAPRIAKMTPEDPTVINLPSTGRSLRIDPPQHQDPDALSLLIQDGEIPAENYHEALVAAVKASGAFTEVKTDGEADYALEPMITGQDVTGMLGATGSIFVYYTIRRASTGQVVWDKEILGKHTATMADALVGATRLKEAKEGAVRDNLRQLLWAFSGGALKDSDGDWVVDDRDKEPNTPPGAEVDLEGRSRDDDHDGVPNGIDLEPNTPPDGWVDELGRLIDADQDGVDDKRDQCPDTPADAWVDARGCPLEVSKFEQQLIDVGKFEETRIYFQTDRATLQPQSFPLLDEIGSALSGLPELRFEVHGHCDETGTDEHNQTLSEERANSVVDYLVREFPGLAREQFQAIGHGNRIQVAPGKDPASLAKNRRVEFVVVNREAAKRQIETKHLLQRGEQTPEGVRGR